MPNQPAGRSGRASTAAGKVVEVGVRITSEGEFHRGVTCKPLHHLGRYSGSSKTREERVTTCMEVRLSALTVTVLQEIGFTPTRGLPFIAGFLDPFAASHSEIVPNHQAAVSAGCPGARPKRFVSAD